MCKEYINHQTGEKLDLKRVIELGEYALLKSRPELWCIWDFEKNNELKIDIWEMTRALKTKVSWYCKYCDDSYFGNINEIYARKDSEFCKIKKMNHENSLYNKKPKLASQWHPTLNGDLTSHDVTHRSEYEAWWLGSCGHYWQSKVRDRNDENEYCGICANRIIVKGINDLNTTHQHMKLWLVDTSISYNYHHGSTKKTDWYCQTCSKIIKNKEIRVIVEHGIPCPNCSKGFSKPERIMSNVLSNMNMEFIYQKTFKWSNGKIYDFYFMLNKAEYIIEMNGEQHSKKGFTHSSKARTLEEEQANDEYKYNLAIKNGIKPENYIVIDCVNNKFSHIKTAILCSTLPNLLNFSSVDWGKIHEHTFDSKVLDVCQFYDNNTEMTIKDIANSLNMSYDTVFQYLNMGQELGVTTYKKNGERGRESSKNKKKVVQIKGGKFIRVWDSLSEAAKSIGASNCSGIRISCLNPNNRTAKGYTWMYLEDYEEMLENQNRIS